MAVLAALVILASGCAKDGATSVTAACDTFIEIDRFELDHADPDYPGAARPLAALWRNVAGLDRDDHAEVIAAAKVMASSIESAVESGDVSALEGGNAEVDVADRDAHRWAYESCGFLAIDLGARDHAFTGVPTRLPAGSIALRLQNGGSEPHAMVLFRVADGVAGTAEEILSGTEQEILQRLERVSSGGFATPGDTAFLTADVEPGRHMLLCPIPGASDDAPHFMHGMVADIEVTPPP